MRKQSTHRSHLVPSLTAGDFYRWEPLVWSRAGDPIVSVGNVLLAGGGCGGHLAPVAPRQVSQPGGGLCHVKGVR